MAKLIASLLHPSASRRPSAEEVLQLPCLQHSTQPTADDNAVLLPTAAFSPAPGGAISTGQPAVTGTEVHGVDTDPTAGVSAAVFGPDAAEITAGTPAKPAEAGIASVGCEEDDACVMPETPPFWAKAVFR